MEIYTFLKSWLWELCRPSNWDNKCRNIFSVVYDLTFFSLILFCFPVLLSDSLIYVVTHIKRDSCYFFLSFYQTITQSCIFVIFFFSEMFYIFSITCMNHSLTLLRTPLCILGIQSLVMSITHSNQSDVWGTNWQSIYVTDMWLLPKVKMMLSFRFKTYLKIEEESFKKYCLCKF